MKKVKIYSTNRCPFCVMANRLLTTKNIPFEEIKLDNDPDLKADLIKQTGHRTVPQIFIGNDFIGGYQELAALDEQNKLENALKD